MSDMFCVPQVVFEATAHGRLMLLFPYMIQALVTRSGALPGLLRLELFYASYHISFALSSCSCFQVVLLYVCGGGYKEQGGSRLISHSPVFRSANTALPCWY